MTAPVAFIGMARFGTALWPLRETVRIVRPREHGSWSLALEPLALGLVAAPSAAGAMLALAVLAGFFLRRPLKILWSGSEDSRRSLAAVCVFFLGIGVVAGVVLAAVFGGPAHLWPLLLAVPAGAAFIWFDSRDSGREAATELAGATAFAVVPAAVASLAGWSPASALALAAVMAGRSIPTVITIRAYLRRNKGQPVSLVPAMASSVGAVVLSLFLVAVHLAPWVAVLCAVLWFARTTVLLGAAHPHFSASRLGLAEAVTGGILVVFLALSWSSS